MPRISLLPLAAALLFVPVPGRAGCLAPADTAIDTPAPSAPVWGNDAGSLIYAKLKTATSEALVVRSATGAIDEIAVQGQLNEFFVGLERERWETFHTAHVNAAGDAAFIASTKVVDDPATAANEAAPRRGVYAKSGSQLYRLARNGEPSPVRDAFNTPIKWGTLFDAVALPADDQGDLRAMFSGQVAGQFDQRIGLFRWVESSPAAPVAALLTGDASPSGGSFTSFGRLRSAGGGDVVFFAVTKLTESSPQVPGLFLLRPDGSKARIVKFGTAGDAAPGGGTFGLAGDFDADAAGTVYFTSSVENGAAKSALFRAAPPMFVPELVVSEGDPTPIAGTFGPFTRAVVRANADGELVLGAELSDDAGGDGLFTVPAGSAQPSPLVLVDDVLGIAAIGTGRAAYLTSADVRVVVPSDGSAEGPTDFRLAKLDLRNSVPLKTDLLTVEGRFLLPRWDASPPATLRGGVSRFTPTAELTGAALTRITEVKLFTSSSPGNNFVFGIAGSDAAPTGTVRFNGQAQELKGLSVADDGTSAVWKFAGNPGPGTFSLDLLAGTFSLKVKSATLQPSYEAGNFRIALVLRSEADVTEARADADSWFRRDIRVNGQQPRFGQGRRVTSAGENTAGGTVYVDTIRVTRKAAKGSKPAADSLQLTGTLRLCPGTAFPATSRLPATLRLGSFRLDDIEMSRVGKGAVYRASRDGADLTVDLANGSFSLKVKTMAPLAELVSAVPGSPTNGPERLVGGMQLPFVLDIPRVYEAAFDVPVVRLPKAVLFVK